MKPVKELPPASTVQFSSVQVDGKRATAAIKASNGTGQVQLRKSEGRWKIDDIR